MNQNKPIWHGVIFLFFTIGALLVRCGQNGGGPKKLTTEMEIGKALSEQHCKSCHLYPGPELLDRATWTRVLPGMEMEMQKAAYKIEQEDWYAIQRYYLNTSPALLEPPISKKLDKPEIGRASCRERV